MAKAPKAAPAKAKPAKKSTAGPQKRPVAAKSEARVYLRLQETRALLAALDRTIAKATTERDRVAVLLAKAEGRVH